MRRLLLPVFGFLLAAACSDETLVRAKAQIDTDPTQLDFGEAAEGTVVERTLTLLNPGGTKLTIAHVSILDDTRGAFAFVPLTTDGLAGGATLPLTVRFTAGVVGSVDNARLLIESNADNAPARTVPLAGRGLRAALPDAGTTTPDSGPALDAQVDGGTEPTDTGLGTGTWVTGAWGPCSEACGTGTHTRGVTCQDASGATLPDASCADTRPGDTEACTDQSGCNSCTPTCPGTCSFTTPGEYTVTLPTGCSSVRATMWGGGGGGGVQQGATGGGGAYAYGRITRSGAVDQLAVWVGQGGGQPGSGPVGDGAGASYVLRGATRLLVAAGGGGGGNDGCSGCSSGGAGGAGGASLGEDGANLVSVIAPYCTSAIGGQGASTASGGVGGTWTGTAPYPCNGEDGTTDTGGASNGGIFGATCWLSRATTWHAGGGQGNGGGGGGGAGYFGGGGAGFIWTYCAGGGGGGSSWADPSVQDAQLLGGTRATQGNAAASNGAGAGGAMATAGANGRVTLSFDP